MIQHNSNGFIQFAEKPLTQRFSDLFTTKVGAVPRSKEYAMRYRDDSDYVEMVHSGTVKDHSLVLYDTTAVEWIRPWNGEKASIFVNAKTRSKTPFFCREYATAWDGSVIALFPSEICYSRLGSHTEMVKFLNSLDWFELGCEDAGGRKHFSVGVFDRMMLP